MAGSYNRVTLIGNVGRDPDVRVVPGGQQVADFSLATTEKTREGEHTTWWRCTCWEKLADVAAQYVHKGSYLYVEGPAKLRDYTDRDGNTRASLDVTVRELRLLDRRVDGDRASGGEAARPTTPAARGTPTAAVGGEPDIPDWLR